MLAPQLGHKKGKTQACPDPHAEAESAKDHECADDEGPKPTGREMEVPAGTLRQASLVRFQHLQSSSRDSRSAGRGTAVAGGGQGNLESKQATDHDELWASKQHAPGESGAPLMLWGHREMA